MEWIVLGSLMGIRWYLQNSLFHSSQCTKTILDLWTFTNQHRYCYSWSSDYLFKKTSFSPWTIIIQKNRRISFVIFFTKLFSLECMLTHVFILYEIFQIKAMYILSLSLSRARACCLFHFLSNNIRCFSLRIYLSISISSTCYSLSVYFLWY